MTNPKGATIEKALTSGQQKGRIAGVIFGGLFCLAGIGFVIPTLILPLYRMAAASSWNAVPCTILSSGLKTNSSSEGETYSVAVTYAYRMGDIRYVGTRYDFLTESSSGYDAYRAIVDQLKPGKKTICFVNPNRPGESVLSRGPRSDLWFGLIPLLFVAVGATVMIVSLRSGMVRTPIGAVSFNLNSRSTAGALRQRNSPLTKVAFLTFACLFWNGSVGLFVYFIASGWKAGRGELFPTLLISVFVIIGIALLGAWIVAILALFNPRPQVNLAQSAPALGDSTDMRWSFKGNYTRISRLTITVEGREEARYQRGTQSYLDTNTFLRIPVADIARQTQIASGSAQIAIPIDTMHSFEGRHNKIIWLILIHGDISTWPDVKAEFPMTVQPLPARDGSV